jgi:hypothetical protein
MSCDISYSYAGILKRRHLEDLMNSMVLAGDAAYEPEKQTSSALVYWRRPDQWAETIYDWVRFAFRSLSPTLSQNGSIHSSHFGFMKTPKFMSCHANVLFSFSRRFCELMGLTLDSGLWGLGFHHRLAASRLLIPHKIN